MGNRWDVDKRLRSKVGSILKAYRKENNISIAKLAKQMKKDFPHIKETTLEQSVRNVENYWEMGSRGGGQTGYRIFTLYHNIIKENDATKHNQISQLLQKIEENSNVSIESLPSLKKASILYGTKLQELPDEIRTSLENIIDSLYENHKK